MRSLLKENTPTNSLISITPLIKIAAAVCMKLLRKSKLNSDGETKIAVIVN